MNVCLDSCLGVQCSNGQRGFGRRRREVSEAADPNKVASSPFSASKVAILIIKLVQEVTFCRYTRSACLLRFYNYHCHLFIMFFSRTIFLNESGVRDQHVHGNQDGVRRLQSWQAGRGGDHQPYTGKGHYWQIFKTINKYSKLLGNIQNH